jgi:hypothetical protein
MKGKYESIMGANGAATGYAVRAYADASGAHRCDVWLSGGRGYFEGCYVMNGQTSKIGAPSEPWRKELDPRLHPLVLVIFRDAGLNPIVLGRIDAPEITYAQPGQRPPHNPEVEPAPAQSTVQDVILANGQARIRILETSAGGDILMEPVRHLNVQLKEGGQVHIGGAEGYTDGPVLASRHVDRDDEIRSLLQQLVTWATGLTVTTPTGTISTPVNRFTGSGLAPLSADDIRSAVLTLSSNVQSGAGSEPDTEGEETE